MGVEIELTEDFARHDAVFVNSKGHRALVEFKFRNKAYDEMMLEFDKLEALRELKKTAAGVTNLYYINVIDNAYYIWDVTDIEPEWSQRRCPGTTCAGSYYVNKKVCYLPLSVAKIKGTIGGQGA